MSFTECFRPFVCPGDVISCETGPFTLSAQVVIDDCQDSPDQRQDGFWPSLYIGAPGFIGPGNNFRQRFAAAQASAEAVMEGWRQGDWFYCGIVLSVTLEDVDLVRTAAALFGIEANYPGTDNSYLTDVANELVPEAVAAARETLVRLAARAQAMEGA